MKIVLLQTMCTPKGNGFPGTVLDLPDALAKKYLHPVEPDPDDPKKTIPRTPIARLFSKETDTPKKGRKKVQYGLQVAEESE